MIDDNAPRLLPPDTEDARPLWPVTVENLEAFREGAEDEARRWLAVQDFRARPGEVALIPDQDGRLDAAVFGLGDAAARAAQPLGFGALPFALPEGAYRLSEIPNADEAEAAALGWLLGSYRFTRYCKSSRAPAQLVAPQGVEREEVERIAAACCYGRDLINIPANDMGPAALEAAFRDTARAYGAEAGVIAGAGLLEHNYPMIHAVGRAGPQAPRLLDMRWGAEDAPKLTLVGKGVCYDTGGLDIKPSHAMGLMKKDMGGAASVLALARLIMGAGLRVRLRVMIPAVENSISGESFRHGDILTARNGKTIEIGNTDAEGRLVLADALVEADSEDPDLIIDMATLTGAARVALGPDLPPFYTNDDSLAEAIIAGARRAHDPLWRMPLWAPYDSDLRSYCADMNNITPGGFAGSITAALFLQRFVDRTRKWAHFDIYGWTPKPRPGRPEGGEAQGVRALYAMLSKRYA